jgi:hypothetical protein
VSEATQEQPTSEPQVEAASTSSVATADAEPEITYPDPLSEGAFKQIIGFTTEHNTKIGQINAVKGDPTALMKSLRENSTTDSVIAARTKRDEIAESLAQAEEELDLAVKPEYDAALKDVEGKVKELEEEAKTLEGKIRAATTYIKKSYVDFFNKFGGRLPKLDRVKGAGGTRSGSGGKRIRGYSVVMTRTVDGEEKVEQFENFSALAKELSVATADLQEGFFTAAGNPAQLKNAPDVVEWDMGIGAPDSPDSFSIHLKAERDGSEAEEDDEDDSTESTDESTNDSAEVSTDAEATEPTAEDLANIEAGNSDTDEDPLA